MTFVEFLNQRFKAATGDTPTVVYGQNVSTGSCLSGLSRGFDKLEHCTVINTTNSESTLVGIGFGLILRNVPSFFFMKQQDFLLLGIEQLTDTWNAIRHRPLAVPYNVVAITVDSGWEGPQSCLNHLADFSSISRVPGFSIATRAEAEAVIDRHATAPGLRIFGVSQRLFREPPIDYGAPEALGADAGVIRYAEGADATIVAFNLAFPQAMMLHRELARTGRAASLFSVPATLADDTDAILADAARNRRLVVIDDGKSVNRPSTGLIATARAQIPDLQVVEIARAWTPDAAAPNTDELALDLPEILAKLGLGLAA